MSFAFCIIKVCMLTNYNTQWRPIVQCFIKQLCIIMIIGYSVVSHNKTVTSPHRGATPVVTQQQSSITAVDDHKV